MTDNLKHMSVEQIIAQIEDFKTEIDENFLSICNRLVELKRRKVVHPLHKDRVFRWFELISKEQVHPGLVRLWNGNPAYIDCVVGRPMDIQKNMLAGVEYSVVYERQHEIKEVRKSVYKMALAQFQRAFPKGAPPATVKEQFAAIQSEIDTKSKTVLRSGPIVKANASTRVLRVGNTEVPLHIVRAALAEIGLELLGLSKLEA